MSPVEVSPAASSFSVLHLVLRSIMHQAGRPCEDEHMVLPKAPEVVIETTPVVVAEATSNMPEPGKQTSDGRVHQEMDTIARKLLENRLVEERVALLERARDLGATNFSGSTNPDDSKEWIQRLEDIFDFISCSDEQKLSLARFLLKGNAYYWWKAVERWCPDPSTITWADFRLKFYDRYFPRTYRDAKLREFLQLVQGYMTVSEYEDKFIYLSRFGEALVANEADMCRRFEDGLRRDIRMIVTAVGWTEFLGLVEAAKRVELCINEQQQHLNTNSGQRGSQKLTSG